MDLAFEERHPHEAGFGAFFADEIRPVLQHVEATRVRAHHLKRARSLLVAVVAVPSFLLLWSIHEMFPDQDWVAAALWAVIIGTCFSWWWIDAPRRHFDSMFKERVLKRVADWLGFAYFHEGRDLHTLFDNTGIVHDHNQKGYEDCFTGTHRGVEFAFEELKLAVVKASKHGKTEDVKFKGVAVVIQMNKRFDGHTILIEDRGSILNWMQSKRQPLSRVELESRAFEDRFEAYSTDQIEARYLLTPAFMERLLRVSEGFGHVPLRACFRDERLYMLIPHEEALFEAASLGQTVLQTEGLRRVLAQVQSLREIIDELKLNQRLGL